MEDHPTYQRDEPLAPSAAEPTRATQSPLAASWPTVFLDDPWVVSHVHEVERVYTRVWQETRDTLGDESASRLRVDMVVRLLKSVCH